MEIPRHLLGGFKLAGRAWIGMGEQSAWYGRASPGLFLIPLR